jgi:hypothetical protein
MYLITHPEFSQELSDIGAHQIFLGRGNPVYDAFGNVMTKETAIYVISDINPEISPSLLMHGTFLNKLCLQMNHILTFHNGATQAVIEDDVTLHEVTALKELTLPQIQDYYSSRNLIEDHFKEDVLKERKDFLLETQKDMCLDYFIQKID